MIISDLNYLEVVSPEIQGGTYTFTEIDKVKIKFSTTNKFKTIVKTDICLDASTASFGAKSSVIGASSSDYTYTKADGLAVVDLSSGTNFSAATGVAVVQPMPSY
jgi:hypothetical protein